MCGYCTEAYVYDFWERQKNGKSLRFGDGIDVEFIFQETDNPLHILERFMVAARRRKIVTWLPLDDVLICRAVDLLLDGGPGSLSYQRFIKKKFFKQEVVKPCHGNTQVKTDCFTGRFELNRLAHLYEVETWSSKGSIQKLLEIAAVKDETLTVLRNYIRWWLKGENLKMDDINKDNDGAAIFEIVSNEAYEEFEIIFRAVWFSLNFIGRFQAGKNILKEIVRNCPIAVPLPDGKDLWIQRRAALMLFNHDGLAPFLEQGCRVSLLYYLHLRRGLTLEQMDLIALAAGSLPQGAFIDDEVRLQDWLNFSGDPLLFSR